MNPLSDINWKADRIKTPHQHPNQIAPLRLHHIKTTHLLLICQAGISGAFGLVIFNMVRFYNLYFAQSFVLQFVLLAIIVGLFASLMFANRERIDAEYCPLINTPTLNWAGNKFKSACSRLFYHGAFLLGLLVFSIYDSLTQGHLFIEIQFSASLFIYLNGVYLLYLLNENQRQVLAIIHNLKYTSGSNQSISC